MTLALVRRRNSRTEADATLDAATPGWNSTTLEAGMSNVLTVLKPPPSTRVEGRRSREAAATAGAASTSARQSNRRRGMSRTVAGVAPGRATIAHVASTVFS